MTEGNHRCDLECNRATDSQPEIEETQSDRIERMLSEVLDKMSKVEEMTATVIAEVKPTIDEFMNSSLGKMLGVGKKK